MDKYIETKLGIKLGRETLKDLDSVLSAIINDEENNMELITSMLTLITKDECTGFHYIIIEFIERLVRIKNNTNVTKIVVTRDSFNSFLLINLERFINNDEINIKVVLGEVQENISMDTLEGRIRSKQILYTYCMKKFDELKNNEIDVLSATMLLENLYQGVVNDYSINSVRMGAMALESSITIGKNTFSQGEGYFNLTQHTLNKIQQKSALWTNLQSSVTALDSLEDYLKLCSDHKNDIVPICEFGFEPIDMHASVCTGDIISVVATEGTGKTNYCAGFAVREVMAGFSIIFMCGESHKVKIINMILSHYIYLMTGYEIGWKEIMYDFDELPESWQGAINECRYRLFNDPSYGKIKIVGVFTYNNFKQEVLNIVKAHPKEKFGHIILDHTDALEINNNVGDRYLKDKYAAVPFLFEQIKAIKRDYNIATLTTSHTSSEAEKAIVKGKETGTRIGATSSSTSKDVDIVILFDNPPEYKKKGLIRVMIKKFREVEDTLFQPFIVKKDFKACNFRYSPELQNIMGVTSDKELKVSEQELEELIGE